MKSIGLLSSNLPSSRLGDKCDRSMTRGKLLDNNPTLFFLFFSLLIMTEGTRKETTGPILGTAILGTNQLQLVEWEGVAYCSCVGISGNIPRFVYVDLIGKTIQVILE